MVCNGECGGDDAALAPAAAATAKATPSASVTAAATPSGAGD